MTMESTFGIGNASDITLIIVRTVRHWEREGRLIPVARTAGNCRLWTESELRAFLRLRNHHRHLRATLESNYAAGAPDQD